MRADALKGRGVVALTTAERLGQVDDVLFDPQYQEVLGFRVKQGGLFGQTEVLLRDNVAALGADALTVPSPDVINEEGRFAELAHAATLSQVVGTKVVTEGGELLGTIVHLEVDDDARTVTAYRLASSLSDRVLGHDAEAVAADEVLRLGDGGSMIVPDAVGARLRVQRG